MSARELGYAEALSLHDMDKTDIACYQDNSFLAATKETMLEVCWDRLQVNFLSMHDLRLCVYLMVYN